jgi:alkylation response protein AidB-like acyl-CoA dehydrogenase
VNFELTAQQLAFRDLIREFALKSISPVAREWELAGRYPTEIVEQMKAMGLFGMLVPEEFGGIAIDTVSYSIVFEEISKAWMGVAGFLRLTFPGNAVAREIWNPRTAPALAAGSRHG